MLAGVAAGLAEATGLPVVAVRVAFALLAVAGGAGLAAYAVFWVFLPQAERAVPRESWRRTRGAVLVVLGVAALVAVGAVPGGRSAGPLLAVLAGVALVWQQADAAERARWRASATGSRGAVLRLGSGAALLVGGLIGFLASRGQLAVARAGLLSTVVVVLGLVLLSSPWWVAMATDLREERRERVRSQERAEVAAHLHDSVLQTLALIQRSASSAAEVTRLARGQERELRRWLYAASAPVGTLAAALRGVADDAEQAHGVPVELVVVGDSEVDEHLLALVAATREAVVNAARHAGRGRPSTSTRRRSPSGSASTSATGGAGSSRRTSRPTGRGCAARSWGGWPGTAAPASCAPRPARGPRSGWSCPVPDDPAPVTVVLVDDHRLFRSGVRAEIGPAVDVVGEASTVAEAVEVVRRLRPQVVLLDVHLPDGSGSAVIAGVGQGVTRFLALSVSDAAEDVIAVIRAGARGYVTKTVAAEELAAAVRRVADGDAVFSPRLAGFVLDAFRAETPAPDSELDRLTAREREVLRLLARGYTYREIAAELFISVKTVETHASAVLRKLQLSNRRELSRWARDRSLD